MGKGEDVINEKINEKEEEYEEYVDSLSELQTATDRAHEIKEEDIQSNIMDWSGSDTCIVYSDIVYTDTLNMYLHVVGWYLF